MVPDVLTSFATRDELLESILASSNVSWLHEKKQLRELPKQWVCGDVWDVMYIHEMQQHSKHVSSIHCITLHSRDVSAVFRVFYMDIMC